MRLFFFSAPEIIILPVLERAVIFRISPWHAASQTGRRAAASEYYIACFRINEFARLRVFRISSFRIDRKAFPCFRMGVAFAALSFSAFSCFASGLSFSGSIFSGSVFSAAVFSCLRFALVFPGFGSAFFSFCLSLFLRRYR